MSDRSDEALRERLELASYATLGPWKSVEVLFRKKNFEPSYVVKDGDGRTIVDIISVAAYQETARHIAASSPDVVLADLEEILALRAEVARLNREADWLAEHLHRAGIPCPGDGEKFDPYGECAKKGWPCVACFREWARQETQEGE